ncbi:MAG: exopolysaccharide biosynthesis polyprenyl glycosylphosphotransferase [Arthrobacter sp.]|jgi:exopolysaccharide biosynthesis polyprenyl glycosylphosphotransferase|nr:exopolysaccharide biosynthesis polyprenyl glycosylphosphotransferase [Arthrobacter sp.]
MFVEDVIGVVSGGGPRAGRVAWGTLGAVPRAPRAAAVATESFSVRASAARWREWVTPVVDVVAVGVLALAFGAVSSPEVAVAAVAFCLALLLTGSFAPRAQRQASGELIRVGVAWLMAASVLAVQASLTEAPHGLDGGLAVLLAAGTAVVFSRTATRLGRRLAVHRGHGVEKVVVVGDFERATRVAASVERAANGTAHVVSLVCPAGNASLPDSVGSAAVVSGGLDATVLTTLYTRAGRVVVADGGTLTGEDFSELAWQLGHSAAGVRVDLATGLDGVGRGRMRLVPNPCTALVAVTTPAAANPWRTGAKRLLDLALALPALVLLAPAMLALAGLVRLDSAGPVFFKQRRVGRNGAPFTMYKFRTMRPDAEAQLKQLAGQNEAAGPLFKLSHDPRITRAGRLLRRTSLDELPQLLNVVRGHMSLVGPRPALPDEVARYDELAIKRLRVKPGLTGPWQVGGRSELGWDEGLRLDLGYVENWSIPGDVSLLVKTVKAVVSRRGAY